MRIEARFDDNAVQKSVEKQLKEILFEVMLDIRNTSKRKAPVDSGKLRASIHMNPREPADKIIVADGVKYGVYQEFGTGKSGSASFVSMVGETKPKYGEKKGITPQPFFRPSVLESMARARRKHNLK